MSASHENSFFFSQYMKIVQIIFGDDVIHQRFEVGKWLFSFD